MQTFMLNKRMMMVFLMFCMPTLSKGHEKHEHHLMGTVNVVDIAHLDIKTFEGKTISVAITPATKVFLEKRQVSAADIEKGTRVVIQTDTSSEKPTAAIIYLQPRKGKSPARPSSH